MKNTKKDLGNIHYIKEDSGNPDLEALQNSFNSSNNPGNTNSSVRFCFTCAGGTDHRRHFEVSWISDKLKSGDYLLFLKTPSRGVSRPKRNARQNEDLFGVKELWAVVYNPTTGIGYWHKELYQSLKMAQVLISRPDQYFDGSNNPQTDAITQAFGGYTIQAHEMCFEYSNWLNYCQKQKLQNRRS